MTYKYKRPEGKLYKVPMYKWSKVFSKRGTSIFITSEVYVSEDIAVIHYVVNLKGKAVLWLLSPLIIIYGTLCEGLKVSLKEFHRAVNAKRYGTFSSDICWKSNTESWDKLMKLIGEQQ